jgi:hypothetical protein
MQASNAVAGRMKCQHEIALGGLRSQCVHLFADILSHCLCCLLIFIRYCCLLLAMQGTLRAALDDGILVDKATGCQHLPSVLSLAHNVACAMTYLHQARAMALQHVSTPCAQCCVLH